MRISARGCQKTRNDSKKLGMYSKQWSPGDTLRVFYPIYWEDGQPEIAVGALWGHNVSDIKGLGLKTAFIPSLTEFRDGVPVGKPDLTYQFSLIAPVFVAGAKLQEEANILSKKFPTEAARKEALKTIEEKYDSKNNMSAVKPIIGRAQYYISTEVVSFKFNNGIYDKESIALSSAPLSGQTIDRLYAILNDPKYRPAEGEERLEVEWKYPVTPRRVYLLRQLLHQVLQKNIVHQSRIHHSISQFSLSWLMRLLMRIPLLSVLLVVLIQKQCVRLLCLMYSSICQTY